MSRDDSVHLRFESDGDFHCFCSHHSGLQSLSE